MSHKNVLVGIALFVLLCLLATTFVWGQSCKKVNVVRGGPTVYLEGPENCNGYDACLSYEIDGTPRGAYTTHWNNVDLVPVGGDTTASVQYTILETAHGDLLMQESVIVDWGALDGFAAHARVVGGTGRYEGATGWTVTYGNLDNTFLRIGGEICY